MQQTAWLFTREGESVRLEVEVQDGSAGAQLFVSGPGEVSNAYDFDDERSLEGFRTTYERDLLERGFRLQAVAERRGGTDRRTDSRPGVRERRRSRSK
jgi:hypothetical protein